MSEYSHCQEVDFVKKKAAPLRRAPQQERGQRRLDKILEAAGKVIAKVGYEGATTNAIAHAARTSIGSLYQFFPNKEAILEALAERYLNELRAVHNTMLDETAAQLPMPELYDRIISTLAHFHATHPAFGTMFFGSTTSPQLAAAADALTEECIGRVDAMMAVREPQLDTTRRRLCATINVHVMKTLMHVANAADAKFRGLLLAEIKTLLLAHMNAVLGDG
jgi:AcrR family transcriptional regulator